MDVREKLVELIGSTEYGNGSLVGNNFQKGFIEKIATHLIANGVTVQEWISVKDKLPENDGQYLIFTTQYFTPDHIDEIDHIDGIEISGYSKRFGFLSKNGIYAKYWCEMPQPPKEGAENG